MRGLDYTLNAPARDTGHMHTCDAYLSRKHKLDNSAYDYTSSFK